MSCLITIDSPSTATQLTIPHVNMQATELSDYITSLQPCCYVYDQPLLMLSHDTNQWRFKSKIVGTVMKKEDGRTFFHSLIHTKHPLRLYKSSEVGSMVHKGDSITVGCKVLPICDAGSVSSDGADGRGSFGAKCDRRTAVLSRMKELVKWAAAAKANKAAGIRGLKILYFRNRATLRDPLDDSSSTSSRISFKWDVGSCSASSTVYSPMAMVTKHLPDVPECDGSSASSTPESEEYCLRTAHWITTDADFVVLEL